MVLRIRIREIREAKGMTVTDLASRVGISIPHMSQVERGVKNLNNHLLERIAKALNVEPYELISDNTGTDALAEIASHLSDEDRKRLVEFARALLASDTA